MSFVKKVTTPTGISINPQGTELTICSFDKASPTIVRARISPEGFLGFSTPAPPPGGVVRPLAVFSPEGSSDDKVYLSHSGAVHHITSANLQHRRYGGLKTGFRDGDETACRFGIALRGGCCDAEGVRIYVADPVNNRIRVIGGDHQVTSIGSGKKGLKDGPPNKARFDTPTCICWVPSRRLYYAADHFSIRSIDPTTHHVTTITGIAGDSTTHLRDGPLNQACFHHIISIAPSPCGDLLFVIDAKNSAIRVVDLKEQIVRTVIAKVSSDTSIEALRAQLGPPTWVHPETHFPDVETWNARFHNYQASMFDALCVSPFGHLVFTNANAGKVFVLPLAVQFYGGQVYLQTTITETVIEEFVEPNSESEPYIPPPTEVSFSFALGGNIEEFTVGMVSGARHANTWLGVLPILPFPLTIVGMPTVECVQHNGKYYILGPMPAGMESQLASISQPAAPPRRKNRGHRNYSSGASSSSDSES